MANRLLLAALAIGILARPPTRWCRGDRGGRGHRAGPSPPRPLGAPPPPRLARPTARRFYRERTTRRWSPQQPGGRGGAAGGGVGGRVTRSPPRDRLQHQLPDWELLTRGGCTAGRGQRPPTPPRRPLRRPPPAWAGSGISIALFLLDEPALGVDGVGGGSSRAVPGAGGRRAD